MKSTPTHFSYTILRLLAVFTLLFLIGCKNESNENVPWDDLFDGKTLSGWEQKGGQAIYEVKDGAIVGKTVSNTPNSFLVTTKRYADFILELDVKVHPSMNSGIQIRSNSFEHYQKGRVHGYQVEIDPSDRAWSGGIYDEGRRGWLYDLSANPDAQGAFRPNDWNHYRIEAIGDTLKTWVNEKSAAYLVDEKTRSGFIGLQVHSIGDDEEPGKKVIWKNLKILTKNLDQHLKESTVEPRFTKNRLTSKEKMDGWKMLWDGSTTAGWRGARLDRFPEKGWLIEQGILTVLPSGGGESQGGGDIVTEELYGDFELKVDFRITQGANSGIKYYVDTELNKGEGSAIGLEYQILDDAVHPDARLGRIEGIRTMASLYDLIRADPDKPVNPIGQWNSAHIVSKNNHVEHWINGVKVLEYERGSPEFRKLVAESKYAKWTDFGELEQGRILLQDHGDQVSFKNIKIRPLEKTK